MALLAFLVQAIRLIVRSRRRAADSDYVRAAEARAVELYDSAPGARAGDGLPRRDPEDQTR